MACPVCGGSYAAEPIPLRRRGGGRVFFRCTECSFVRSDPAADPDEEEARRRYALHRNSRDDGGYVAFLSEVIDAGITLLERDGAATHRSRRLRALDWGSGPTPVCAELLAERGLDVAAYDPLFAPEPPPRDAFDLVLCIEVAEHFRDPLDDFLAMASRVRPGGVLALRTLIAPHDDGVFASWWYAEDPTHLSFFGEASLGLLARYASLSLVEIRDGRLALFRRPRRALVAGGANMDVQGRPSGPFRAGDSLPGTVRYTPGGAGRNVAENLARCGIGVSLFSAVGDDPAGRELLRQAEAAGVDCSPVLLRDDAPTGSYLAVLDREGDLAAAVCSAEAVDSLDAAAGASAVDVFLSGGEGAPSALILDANLPPPCAEALMAGLPGVPAWLEPVSVEKALRFAGYRDGALLALLEGMKPNALEAVALAERRLPDGAQIPRAAAEAAGARLLSSGVGSVHVSLGVEGVRYMGRADGSFVPPPAPIVSATGAGDAYLAALVRARLLGLNEAEGATLGCAAAALALGSESAVPPNLTALAVERLAASWRRSGLLVGEDGVQ